MLTKRETARTLRINRTGVVAPSAELIRFAKEAGAKQRPYEAAERRSEVRRAIAVPVLAQPLDDEGTLVGEPFMAVTRDLSPSGLAMFHTRPVSARRLLVEYSDFIGDSCRAVLEVLRCRSVEGYFEIAGRMEKPFSA